MTVTGRVSVGHPVDVATGTLFHEVDDYVQPGRMPLVFRRRYSSRLVHRRDGMLGPGWSSPWEMRIREDLEGFRLILEDGETEITFGRAGLTGNQGTAKNLGSFHELAVEPSGLMVTRWTPDGREVVRYFFPRPRGEEWVYLASRQSPDGEGIDVDREPTGRIRALRQRREKRGFRLAYDDEGRVVEVFLFARIVEVVGGLPEIRTFEKSILRYSYEKGLLTACTDPGGHRTAYLYDAKGRKVREVLRSGASWTFVYDAQDRCVRASGPDQYDDRSFRYGERITEVTDSKNGVWTYHWNDAGQVEVAVSPQGFATRSAFDEYGRIVQRIDPNGHGYQFEYDEDGNRSAIVDPAGRVTRFGYAPDRQLQRMVDRAGQSWEREYDNQHRLASIRDPLGGNWSFSWNG